MRTWSLWVLLVALGCNKSQANHYATPEEVFAAARKAIEEPNVGKWVDCYTSEVQAEQVEMVMSIFVLSGDGDTAAETPEQKRAKEEFVAILEKHGLKDRARRPGESEEQSAARLVGQIRDKRAFLVDHVTWYQAKKGGDKKTKGKLVDVKITGDTANGTFENKEDDGSTMSQEVRFRQKDGSWRIDSIIGF